MCVHGSGSDGGGGDGNKPSAALFPMYRTDRPTLGCSMFTVVIESLTEKWEGKVAGWAWSLSVLLMP